MVRNSQRFKVDDKYVIAAKCMGDGYFHILWRYLTQNFLSSILFIVVMNIGNAIVEVSALSYMGGRKKVWQSQ